MGKRMNWRWLLVASVGKSKERLADVGILYRVSIITISGSYS
jgi:hypothetical protein